MREASAIRNLSVGWRPGYYFPPLDKCESLIREAFASNVRRASGRTLSDLFQQLPGVGRTDVFKDLDCSQNTQLLRVRNRNPKFV